MSPSVPANQEGCDVMYVRVPFFTSAKDATRAALCQISDLLQFGAMLSRDVVFALRLEEDRLTMRLYEQVLAPLTTLPNSPARSSLGGGVFMSRPRVIPGVHSSGNSDIPGVHAGDSTHFAKRDGSPLRRSPRVVKRTRRGSSE